MNRYRVFLIAYEIKGAETKRTVRDYVENPCDSVRISDSAYAVKTQSSDNELYDAVESHLSMHGRKLSQEDNFFVIQLIKPATVKVGIRVGSWLDSSLPRNS
ncbi:MAG: hypothetical protein OXH76_18385 [Boseongicola sp.]|nr:hypothetical protein [Boseongicola sp.]